jgi:hypothetical protein
MLHEVEHRPVEVPGRRRDRQQQRPVPLPACRHHRLVRIPRDDVQLVQHTQRRVPTLQRPRLGRQRRQRRVRVRHVQPILKHLHPVAKLVVQLHHAAGRVEHDPGLPLVRRDTQHLRTLDPISEQPVQRQRRSQRGLAVAAWHRHQPLTDPRREHPAHEVPLPVTQPQRLPCPRPLRDLQVAFDERYGPVATVGRQRRNVQRRSRHRSLRACTHIYLLQVGSGAECVTETSLTRGSRRGRSLRGLPRWVGCCSPVVVGPFGVRVGGAGRVWSVSSWLLSSCWSVRCPLSRVRGVEADGRGVAGRWSAEVVRWCRVSVRSLTFAGSLAVPLSAFLVSRFR